MPTLRSLADLGQVKPKLSLRRLSDLGTSQELNAYQVQREVEARHARKPIANNMPGIGFQEQLAGREPIGTADLVFDVPSRCWMKPVRAEMPFKRPEKGYQPVSDPLGSETWTIWDKASGVPMWILTGSYRHVVREGARAYGDRQGFYVKPASWVRA